MWCVWLLTLAAYWRTEWHSTRGAALLAIVMTVVGTLVMLNLWWFTSRSGGSYLYPSLANFDAHRNWSASLWLMDLPGGELSAQTKDNGYSYAIWMLTPFMRHTGIIVPLMLNALAVMLTVILTGSMCVRLLRPVHQSSAQRIGTLGMLLCASICYLLATGAILIKDALVIFAMTAAARVALGASSQRIRPAFNPIWATLLWCVACLLLGAMRNLCLPMIVLLLLALQRRNRQVRPLGVTVFMVVFALGVAYLSSELFNTENLERLTAVDSGEANAGYTMHTDHHAAFIKIIGDKDEFVSWPFWRKLIWMPVAVVLQFFIPLPWNWGSTLDFGPSQIWARIGLPWYIIGGVIIYYCVFLLWRRSPRQLRRLTVCALVFWLCPCYAVMGTVSRYALPFIPMMLPAAVYALCRDWSRSRLARWMMWWVLAVLTGLVAIYILQRWLS